MLVSLDIPDEDISYLESVDNESSSFTGSGDVCLCLYQFGLIKHRSSYTKDDPNYELTFLGMRVLSEYYEMQKRSHKGNILLEPLVP